MGSYDMIPLMALGFTSWGASILIGVQNIRYEQTANVLLISGFGFLGLFALLLMCYGTSPAKWAFSSNSGMGLTLVSLVISLGVGIGSTFLAETAAKTAING